MLLERVYFNRRMAALLGLGFAAGLPSASGLLGSTLQAWLGDYGASLETIGDVRWVGLPLAFNFVWAPLMDRFTPRILPGMGRRRSWLLVVQVLLVISLIWLALSGPTTPDATLTLFFVAALVVAFFVASQDVVADAYRTDVLPDEELGAGAAVFVNGYRVGMLAAGGGALLLADRLSWPVVYLIMAGLMLVGIVATLLAPEPPTPAPPTTLNDAVVEPIADFVRRLGWRGLAVLAFVVLFKLPDTLGGAMVMPLLQKGLGFSKTDIAIFREWLGIVTLILGAFAGGAVVARLGVIASLWLFWFLQAVSNLGFALLAWHGEADLALLTGVVIIEMFSAGMAAAGFIAFLMSLCNRRYSATQYALFTSLMYGSGAVLGAQTGKLVAALDYAPFFLLTAAAGLPALLLLPLLPRPSRGGAASAEEG